MTGLAADAGAIAGAMLGCLTLVGLVVRYVLVPYLRDQLVKPVQETHRQVTPHDSDHEDQSLTVRDQLDQLQGQVGELSGKVRTTRQLAVAAGRAADAVAGQLKDHEAWAREEDSRLWTALQRHIRAAHSGVNVPEKPAATKGRTHD